MKENRYCPNFVLVDYAPLLAYNRSDVEWAEYFQQEIIAAVRIPQRYLMDKPLFSQRLHAMQFNGLTWYPVKTMVL
jgi:hypothetical protein